MGVVHYENIHLLIHKNEHICASTIYYQVDLVTKVLHCKAKYAMNMKPDPTLFDVGNLILLSNLPKPWTVVCVLEQAISIEYSVYRVINRTEFCECSLLGGPYYLVNIILFCMENAATIDSFSSIYYMFNKILSDYLKAYHQSSPDSDMERALMFVFCF